MSKLLLLAMLLAPVALSGCTEEDVPANALLALAAPTEDGDQVQLAISFIDKEFRDPADTLYFRLNGQDVYIISSDSTAAPRRGTISTDGGSFLYIPSGEYVIELIDTRSTVVFSTPRVSVAKDHLNHLVIFGDKGAWQHIYRSESIASVPEGKIRVVTGNIDPIAEPGEASVCKGPVAAPSECVVAHAALPYGAPWTVDVVPGSVTKFRVAGHDLVDWALEKELGGKSKMLLTYTWRAKCSPVDADPRGCSGSIRTAVTVPY